MISQYLIVLAKFQRIAHIRMLKDHLMKKPAFLVLHRHFPKFREIYHGPIKGNFEIDCDFVFKFFMAESWKFWWISIDGCCWSAAIRILLFSIPISSTGVVRISLVIWTQIIRYHTLWFLNSDLSCLPLRNLTCLVEKCVNTPQRTLTKCGHFLLDLKQSVHTPHKCARSATNTGRAHCTLH